MDYTPAKAFKLLLATRNKDLGYLTLLDAYHRGEQPAPSLPRSANQELKLLAGKAVTNLMDLLVSAPTQGMRVDGFHDFSANKGGEPGEVASRDWDHWQRSRLDARQESIYRSALIFGNSYVVTEDTPLGTVSKGLSPLNTAAVWHDPANDLNPAWALSIMSEPQDKEHGRARLWGPRHVYDVAYLNEDEFRITDGKPHGALSTPVTRFAFKVDLEGRTTGVVGPRIQLQDRVNQAVFDLLVVQSGGAFRVKTVSGMAHPVKTDANGEPIVDPATGKEVPDIVAVNASSFIFAEDENVKFNSLPETPLTGYIECVEMAIKHMLSVSQTPPMLGHMSNISAEFLAATETSLGRLRNAAQVAFGEAWERVARVEAEISGDEARANDYRSEVRWADVEARHANQVADALSKYAALGVPQEGLWPMIPGVTQSTLDTWHAMAAQSDSAGRLADALIGASAAPGAV